MPDVIRMNFIVTDEERKIYKKLSHKKEMSLTDLIKKLLNNECEKENILINKKQEQQ